MNPVVLLIGLGIWSGIFLVAGADGWRLRLFGAAFIAVHAAVAVWLIRKDMRDEQRPKVRKAKDCDLEFIARLDTLHRLSQSPEQRVYQDIIDRANATCLERRAKGLEVKP